MTSTNPTASTNPETRVTTRETSGLRGRSILTRVFAVDRILAAGSALVLTSGGLWIGDLLEWPGWVVTAIGIALAPYAYLLHVVVRDGLHHSAPAKLTAVGDAAWVAGSVALLLGWPEATSTIGTWIIAAMALVVADIGLTKVYGWRRS